MQDEKTKNWKNPIAHSVVATILYRLSTGKNNNPQLPLLPFEFLVTQRVKGAAKGHYQIHHGGHFDVTDINAKSAAVREIREETGFAFNTDDVQFVAMFGPELYRSNMYLKDNPTDVQNPTLILDILKEQAEPTAPFVLTLFIAYTKDILQHQETDGEVNNQEWLTIEEIVARYGTSPTFNYCSFLFEVIKYFFRSHDSCRNFFPDSSPGKYYLYL